MSIAQQGMLIMGIIFCILVIPAIIYTIYIYAVKNKKCTETVEAEFVRFDEIRNIMYHYGRVYIPVYRYEYNGCTYEARSNNIKISTVLDFECKDKVILKIDPDDPYHFLDDRSNIKYKFKKWTVLDTVILIGAIIIIASILLINGSK